jgi:predicted DNA-binding transcriptional regulator AlpA
MTEDKGYENAPTLGHDGLISRKQLKKLIPVSTMTIWRWEKEGHLPRHITIGRTSFWRLAEVLDFIGRSK